MISHKLLWFIFLSFFKVVFLSSSVLIPDAEFSLLDLSAAKEYVVGQLKEKYCLAMGLTSTTYIGWSRIHISGWPASVRCYGYHSWSLYAVQDIYYSLGAIEMTRRDKKYAKEPVFFRKTKNASLAMYRKLLQLLGPIGCVKENSISWADVKNLFPDLLLTTTYFGKWTSSDLQELQSKILDQMSQEDSAAQIIDPSHTSSLPKSSLQERRISNLDSPTENSSQKRKISKSDSSTPNNTSNRKKPQSDSSASNNSSNRKMSKSDSSKISKRHIAVQEPLSSSEDASSIHEAETNALLLIQKSPHDSQTKPESAQIAKPVSRIYPVQTRPLNVPVYNYTCTFLGAEVLPRFTISNL